MTFFSSTLRSEQAAERYLGDIQEVANQMSVRLKAQQAG